MDIDTQSMAPDEAFEAAFSATRLSNWQLDDLLTFWDVHRSQNPQERLLFILDDQDQASYTSHQVLTGGLNLERFDMAKLTPSELAEYEEHCRLSPERQVAVVRTNLAPLIAELSFDGTWAPIASEADLVAVNTDPVLGFGEVALALHVPVTQPTEALLGAPNGYFLGDLTPAQNYVLAEHLRLNYGYELIGLGATLIGFIHTEAVTKDHLSAALDSVAWLFAEWNDTIGEWDDPVPGLLASVPGSRLLFLSYKGA